MIGNDMRQETEKVNNSTIIDLIRKRSVQQPNRTAFVFTSSVGRDEAILTFGDLDKRANAIASFLLTRGEPGDRVLLLFPPGLDYVCAFVGCLYAGMIAVPLYPPRQNQKAERLQAVLANCSAKLALTDAKTQPQILRFLGEAASAWIEPIESIEIEPTSIPNIDPTIPAFLQYTSGSTGDPKGVIVGHENLMANQRAIADAFDLTENDVCVSWLPLYHDMGLIGVMLHTLYRGFKTILMPATTFIRKPIAWLEAIEHYGASVSGGPNFAYDLCVQRVPSDRVSTLNLSNWRLAFNGAEPVRAQTLVNFAEHFAPSGFRMEAFYPCYGMAETTLFISGGPGGIKPTILSADMDALSKNTIIEASDNNLSLVSSGQVHKDFQVRIVDLEQDLKLPENKVGEIWVAGPSVTRGYWNNRDVTKAAFEANLSGEGPFLRTGDLGFQRDGRLYVTGRIKDMLIVRGLNHYPQDIERSVERAHEVLVPGGGATFTIDENDDTRLIHAHEVERGQKIDVQALCDAIRETVAAEHALRLDGVVLLRRGQLPRTSSGKTRRSACTNAFKSQSWTEYGRDVLNLDKSTPEPSWIEADDLLDPNHPLSQQRLQEWLIQQAAAALGVSSNALDPKQPLNQWGLDSISALNLQYKIETQLNRDLPPELLLDGASIQKLSEHLIAAPALEETTPVTNDNKSMVSANQQALFYIQKLKPDSTAYHIPVCFEVSGDLNTQAFRMAFESLLTRHDALRSRFVEQAGSVSIKTDDAALLDFQHLDVAAWHSDQVKDYLKEESTKPFDLSKGVFRLRLLQLGEDRHIVLMMVHHIAMDLWSLLIVLDEFRVFYGYLTGPDGIRDKEKLLSLMPPQGPRHVDFTNWQANMLATERGKALGTFWQKQLEGAPFRLDLPTDFKRPESMSESGDRIAFEIDAVSEVQQVAQEAGVTVYTLLLTVYQLLLHRYSAQEDVLIGSPMTGRSQARWENVVGYFVNMVVLRSHLKDSDRFQDLLQRMHRTVLEAHTHQDFPFQNLVKNLQPERQNNRSPIFQAAFVLQKSHRLPGSEAFALGLQGDEISFGDLQLNPVSRPITSSQFDITLTLAEVAGKLHGVLDFNTVLFERQSMERLTQHYQALLASAIREPHKLANNLSLLSEQDRRSLLAEEPDFSNPITETLIDRFNRAAQQFPEKEALVWFAEDNRGGTIRHTLTYKALGNKVNTLAAMLILKGAGPEQLIGLMTSRTGEMVVGLLAILQAGAAYVPLDPDHPADRTAYILTDTKLNLVITTSDLRDRFPEEITTIPIDKSSESARPTKIRQVMPDNLAYVIYTSGSTGKPKGVGISHRNAVRLFDATNPWFDFSDNDTWTLFHAVVFDFSVWEIWGALLYGGRLVVVPFEVSRTPNAFFELIRSERVTILNQTPSAFRSLAELAVAEPDRKLPLRQVIFGGEALELESLRKWFEVYGDQSPRLVNMYGITETTVHVTFRPISISDLDSGVSSPIGVAIPDLGIQITDALLSPQPGPVPGEMLVTGEGLARGYLGRPALTATRFIPDPHAFVPGARAYRSGDMAFFSTNGDTAFRGRIDRQVKIRGFRIEPGEIESLLRREETIQDVAVIVRDMHQSGEAQLVAYVVENGSCDIAQIRRNLKAQLPAYMIPAAFVVLEKFPLTINGKLDTKALPAPGQIRPDMATAYSAPTTEVEQIWVDIWSQTLGLSRIGINDNFYELGGDSILALQLISKAADHGFQLSIRQLLSHQTIAELALITEKIEPSAKAPSQKHLYASHQDDIHRLEGRITDTSAIWPLSPMQQGLLFHAIYDIGQQAYVEQLSFRINGPLASGFFREAWEIALDRHQSLRASFHWQDLDRPLQATHQMIALPWRELDWSDTDEQDIEAYLETLLEQNRQRGFSLDQAPLLQCTLVRTARDQHRFIFDHHHLLMDGWSLGLLLKEVFSIYETLRNGDQVDLAPAPNYENYLAWLDDRDLGEAYWREYFADLETPSLIRRGVPNEKDAPFGDIQAELTKDLTRTLEKAAKSERVTTNNLVQAAWALTLCRWSGSQGVTMGVTVAGRPPALPQVEQMIGLFINTLPLSARIKVGETVSDLARNLQQDLASHQEFAHTPLSELLKWSNRRDGELFESLLVFENYPLDRALEAAGMIDRIQVSENTHYPITLACIPGDVLNFRMSWRNDQFETTWMEALFSQFLMVLEAITAQPSQLAHQLLKPLPVEQEKIASEILNQDYPFIQNTLHGMFSSQAQRSPDAMALRDGNQQLTYAALEQASDRMASALLGRGLSNEQVVGLLLPRSATLVIAAIAVFKAGGTILILDHTNPDARLAANLSDAEALLTIVDQDHGRVPNAVLAEELTKSSQGPLPLLQPNHAACLYYTSGSTGEPKGVLLNHAAMANRITWAQRQYPLSSGESMLQLAAFHFDIALWEWMAPLVAGGTCVIAEAEALRDPDYLQRLLINHAITAVHFVPSLLTEWLTVENVGQLRFLRRIYCGGDRVPASLVNRCLARTNAQLVQFYGPTETAISVTWSHCDGDKITDRPPIGRAIDGVRVFTVDSDMDLTPTGVPGEIFIAGDALARGYVKRPAQTAERFVPDPHAPAGEAGARAYRSGDHARIKPDGQLEFIGRVDRQVKIRGKRIEPGEIESVMLRQDDIQKAAVTVQPNPAGQLQLVAFIEGTQSDDQDFASRVKDQLATVLPAHMVPALLHVVDKMPMTSTGKIDRKVLPKPKWETEVVTNEDRPADEIETHLLEIFRNVLGLEHIGRHDDFFSLGGDSILSIQVVSRARAAGYQMNPKDLFEQKSVAALARTVRDVQQTTSEDDDGTSPLLPIQQRFFERHDPNPNHYNQAVWLRLAANADDDHLKKATEALIRHHAALRTRLSMEDGVPQLVTAQTEAADCFQILEAKGWDKDRIDHEANQIQASLNVFEGPMLRVARFKGGIDDEDRLLIAIHHLSVDGVSWRIIIEDLLNAYQQIQAGKPIRLQPATTPMTVWSRNLRTYLGENDLADSCTTWQDLPDLPIPIDRHGDNLEASRASVRCHLEASLTQRVLHTANQAYRTRVPELLLTALVRVLSNWTGSTQQLLDLEGHGRESLLEDLDLSRTVGWFTSVYPALFNLPANGDLEASLITVKETLRAMPLNGMAFGLLRYASPSQATRDNLAKQPKAQISFNYLGRFENLIAAPLLGQADEPHGKVRDPESERDWPIDVEIMVWNGQLRIDWHYSRNLHDQSTIDSLADAFARSIEEIADYCEEPGRGKYTPSDMNVDWLRAEELDQLTGNHREGVSIYPLTPLQMGMLFHTLYETDSSAYITQLSFAIHGPLQADAFEGAWNHVLSRHDALRSSFHWEALKAPIQRVLPNLAMPFTQLDWSDQDDPHQLWQELIAQQRRKPFDLASPPLMRITLIKINPEQHFVIWDHHHLLLDGWSLGLVLQDVIGAYQSLVANGSVEASPSQSFSQYVNWLGSQNRSEAKAFWHKSLHGFETQQLPPLPERRELTAEERVGRVERTLSPELSARIEHTARGQGLTTGTLFQGAWTLLEAIRNGRDDVAFGLTVSGRPGELAGVEQMVGLFINTLPIRLQTDMQAQLWPWLRQLQEHRVKVEQNGFVSLVDIAEWSGLAKGARLFDSILVFENYPLEKVLGDQELLQIDQIQAGDETDYPLTLVIIPGESIAIHIDFDQRFITEDTATYLLDTFCRFVTEANQGKDRRLGDFQPLSPQAERRLLESWNRTQPSQETLIPLHQQFQAHANRQPDATALVYAGQSISYGCLASRAHQLASSLLASGAGPERPVALLLDRTPDMVVAILATLETGGFYVPIDVEYPRERITFSLEDSQPAVILINRKTAHTSIGFEDRSLCLDDLHQTGNPAQASRPNQHVHLDNLAYVIYTSGSTGKPKGVAVTHRNAARLFAITQPDMGFDKQDIWSLFHSFAFDFSVWELWGALLSGGRCVIIPYWISRDPAAFAQLLRNEAVSYLSQTPSAFTPLIEEIRTAPDREHFNLKVIVFGGEALSVPALEPWFDCFGENGPRLINMYGITETTVHVTWHDVHGQASDHDSIGSPIPDLKILLFDPNLRLVPSHQPGEIHVGGDGLARGYLKRPSLTAERYIPDPYAAKPGSRLYRSGDAGQVRSDDLVYKGRLDAQVQLHGYRIELGEIETVLLGHADVRDVIVMYQEEPSAHLAAFVAVGIRHDDPELTKQLRDLASEHLPQYMIPSYFQLLSDLPLNANGKVDRKALKRAVPTPETTNEAPRGEAETELCRIWAEVLGLEQVGIHDNFFELGGDSILSIQVVARAKQAGFALTPKDLFEHQTIAALGSLPKIERTQTEMVTTEPFSLTPIQSWCLENFAETPAHYNQSLLLAIDTSTDLEALDRALADLWRLHDSLRLNFKLENSTWYQAYGPVETSPSLIIHDLSSTPIDQRPEALRSIGEDLQASFKLETGPLFKPCYFQMGDPNGKDRLLLAAHHLVIDGVSWRILLEDLNQLYSAHKQGVSPKPALVSTSLQRWSQALAERAQSLTEDDLDFWLDTSQHTPLPFEGTRSDNTTERAQQISTMLSDADTSRLLREVHRTYRTRAEDILVAALVLAIGEWTGEEQVWIDLEGHGREHHAGDFDFSRTTGWFTTIAPLQLPVPARADKTALLAVKERLRAFPERGFLYGVARYLGRQEIQDLTASIPRPDILFNYLGTTSTSLGGPLGLAMTTDELGGHHAPNAQRTHLLAVNAIVESDNLRVDWDYAGDLFKEGTIRAVAESFQANLIALLDVCERDHLGARTPSDFPGIDLDQAALDRLGAGQHTEDLYPLSPLQQGMLFHALYDESMDTYAEQMAFRIRGKQFDANAFYEAWNWVAAAHDFCRLSFHWGDIERPLQMVHRSVNLRWQEEDWTIEAGHDPEAWQARLDRAMVDQRRKGFDFTKPPQMSLALFHNDENDWFFAWNHHHILLDGWSMPLVFKDLFDAYDAVVNNRPNPLRVATPYRNYIQWIEAQDQAAAKAFWQKSLAGYEETTPLPGLQRKRARNDAPTTTADFHLKLDRDLTAALEKTARGERLTVNTLVRGAWALLLKAYANREDVVFGVTVSGRPANLPGVETMAGLFINTLPLRSHFQRSARLSTWLSSLQQAQIEQEAYAFTSLASIQEWHTMAGNQPLFNNLVVFENYPIDESLKDLSGALAVEPVRTVEKTHYPLTLTAEPGDNLRLRLGYCVDTFNLDHMNQLGEQLTLLFTAITEDVHQPLASISALPAKTRQQLLYEWNQTRKVETPFATLAQAFEARAQAKPTATAVSSGDEVITYGALNERANALAHHLLDLGMGPEQPIALLFEPGIDLFIALIACVKTGAFYVPLSPKHPTSRTAYILEDTATKLVLSHKDLAAQVDTPDRTIVYVDSETIEAKSQETPVLSANSQNVAYVIFTSGSTGKPKGVQVTNHNVLRLFQATEPWFKFTETDVWSFFHSFAFDFSVWEIWGALLYGGRVAVVPYWDSRTPDSFAAFLERENVTFLSQTPSAFGRLMRSSESMAHLERCRVHTVIFGGEALDFATLTPAFEHGLHKKMQFVNMYGITETTVHVTYRPVRPEDGTNPDSMIGVPIPDLSRFILNEDLQPLPPGVPGELFIGGAGLARGYLNRPSLTAERFIPNPYAPEPGQRLYRTGDAGAFADDGDIAYRGRIDRQVKVRGFRIELGEIEAAIRAHEMVESAVVTVLGEGEDRKLAAWFLPEGQQETNLGSEIRQFIGDQLPDYMVPAAMTQVESWPLTVNGKIDIKALPHPQQATNTEKRMPRNDVEARLADAWGSVLGLDHIGIDDDFFALGGDSIISIRIVAKAREAGLSISIKQLFEFPTIAALATVAREETVVTETQAPVTGAVPLSPIQAWFFEQSPPNPNHYNQAVVLEPTERLDAAILTKAIAKLVDHHDALRLRFEREGSDWHQSHTDLDDSAHVEERRWPVDFEAAVNAHHTSLNLQSGPTISAVLFRGEQGSSDRLFMVAHHLVVDAVSWRILLADLQTIYRQLENNRAVTLPPKTTSFKAWAEQVTTVVENQTFEEQCEYWLTRRDHRHDHLPCEFDQNSKQNTVEKARRLSRKLNAALTDSLLREISDVYRTRIDDILLTALLRVLNTWSGATAQWIAMESHGRDTGFDHLDLTRTVGWFTALYPVHLELQPGSSQSDQIKSVKEQLRAVPDGGIPFGIGRFKSSTLRPQLQAMPQPEIGFNYLGQWQPENGSESLFQLSDDHAGQALCGQTPRAHLLDLDLVVKDNQLTINWTYASHLFSETAIAELADTYIAELTALIVHCLGAESGGRTPSDYPLARIESEPLDRLIGKGENVEDLYPLSPLQEGMLFHALFDPEGGFYLSQLTYRIDGPLDQAAFKWAWAQTIARHEAMRASFHWQDLEQPLQCIHENVDAAWHELDWQRTGGEAGLEAWLEADREQHFDLNQAPLMRFAVMHTEPERFFFVWTYHHLVMDGWSMPLVFNDVFSAYKARVAGEKQVLPQAKRYRDFIHWLDQADLAEAKDYWRNRLQDGAEPVNFAAPGSTYSDTVPYRHHSLKLTASETADLIAFARSSRSTLGLLVQAAWALVAHQYTGSNDAVIGTTVSGRPPELSGVDNMVGVFINTIPVRIQIDPGQSLQDWLADQQSARTQDLAFSHTPLVQIQAQSELPPNTPLFYSLIIIENYPANLDDLTRGQRLKVEAVANHEQTNYPLTLEAIPGEELFLDLNYETVSFESNYAQGLIHHLRAALLAMLQQPSAKLAELNLLTAAEQDHLLTELNRSEREPLWSRGFMHTFYAQVRQTPQAIAAQFNAETMDGMRTSCTYAELADLADNVAAHLSARGIQRGQLVAVLAPRDIGFLATILGLFKLGAVYLPLDPAHTAERTARVLQIAEPVYMVVSKELHQDWSHLHPYLRLDDMLTDHPGSTEIVSPNENEPAYMIFTSGSTGTPKGAIVNHGGMLNHLASKIETLDMTKDDVIAQNASQVFDISVWQFLIALPLGARVVIMADEIAKEPTALMNTVRERGVTLLELVPTLMDMMLSGPVPEDLGVLRWLIPTGEALPPATARRWFEQFPNIGIVNAYGPTECSDDVTHFILTDKPSPSMLIMPIGTRIRNTQLYVLNRQLRLVPFQAQGELCVAGDCVGGGYWREPARTAQTFVPDPFSSQPGKRLYLTGDRVRYQADGDLLFLGRLDFQVKIRGHRIEPGEVEALLLQHSDVEQALVVAKPTSSGDLALVAYATTRLDNHDAAVTTTLLDYLGEQLPAYFVPSALVLLDSFPLTHNGKIDRKALPEPELRDTQNQYVEPHTATQIELATIWCNVLGVDRVGIHDDFFNLGGHSLLATRIVSRLNSVFPGALTIRELFERTTIAELAVYIDENLDLLKNLETSTETDEEREVLEI